MINDVNKIIAYRLARADEALDLAKIAIKKSIGILLPADCIIRAST